MSKPQLKVLTAQDAATLEHLFNEFINQNPNIDIVQTQVVTACSTKSAVNSTGVLHLLIFYRLPR